MDDLERLERILRGIQKRHAKTAKGWPDGTTLREINTHEDVTEALDYLERVRNGEDRE
jgi:hypothetical protein